MQQGITAVSIYASPTKFPLTAFPLIQSHPSGIQKCRGSFCTTVATKYDRTGSMDMADDAARYWWGDAWRIPAVQEMMELCENCRWTRLEDNNGYIGVSKICYRDNQLEGKGKRNLFETLYMSSEGNRGMVEFYVIGDIGMGVLTGCSYVNTVVSGTPPNAHGTGIRFLAVSNPAGFTYGQTIWNTVVSGWPRFAHGTRIRSLAVSNHTGLTHERTI